MDLLLSIKGFLEASILPQLSYKSFKILLKPLTTILTVTGIGGAATQFAKFKNRRKARRDRK
jgi:hypothetical protein